ncbi:MAG TPA: leucyl aminopeptidase family protein, partial [Methylophilaceae bacterium]|nr:leucyl aminopeptidase family protein [Methylophilaceae bacterium]
MPIQLKQFAGLANEKSLATASHILFVLPHSKPANLPFAKALEAKLKRSHGKYADLAKTAVSADLPNGNVASWVVLDAKQNVFQRHTSLRKALKTLLDEKPESLAIALFGNDEFRKTNACAALYVASVNAAELPTRKKSKDKIKSLKTIALRGWQEAHGYAAVRARVAGNTLTRSLTMLPPNDLTPGIYRDKVAKLAKGHGWKHEEFDMKKLQKM